MYKLYKQLNSDIKERVDKYVQLNKKILYKYVVLNLKHYFFINSILEKLKNNMYIILRNYKDTVMVHYLDNNIIVFNHNSKILMPIEYNDLKMNKLKKNIIKYFLMLYKHKYRM